MQAVWQALQPMHLETSMSLATSPEAGVRAWATAWWPSALDVERLQ
jgi:hypothetical protein